MKKFLHYTLAASLVVPTTMAFVAPVSAKTTPIEDLPATSTTTNVANTYKELERLIDVRLNNREQSFELHFNRVGNNAITIKDVKAHIAQYVTDRFNFKEASPYVGWSIKDVEIETIDSAEKMTFVIRPSYYTTLAQDKEVDRMIKNISADIIKNTMTDFEKTLAIYEYVANFKLTKDQTTTDPQSTYTLLKDKRASARAFALLTFRLLEYNDIPVKVVNGEILGDVNDNLDVNHFWNLVYLNGNWYHLDSALGAGYTGQTRQFPYQYFLLSDQTMQQSHSWTGYSTLPANATKYEKYRYWTKMQHANKHLVYSNGLDLRNELGVDDTILQGYRVKDFVYDDQNNWIYFIGQSHGNYLYKIRPDGNRFEIVSRERGKSVKIEEITQKNKPTEYRLVYERASGGIQTTKIEPQDEVDRKEAATIDSLIKRLPANPSVKQVAEVRAKYNLLPIEARQYLSMEATLLWAAAQGALTASQNRAADIAVQIAMLEPLKPSFRTDVEAARNAYEALTDAEKNTIYNYRDLQQAERQVQDNLSLALRLDRDIEALDVDETSYQSDIERYMDRFNDMTFAQQVLVVKDRELFTKKLEVLAHIAVAADFDYRVEMLEEDDPRIIEKVKALRDLYDEIHVVQDRNIKRYDRLIALEQYIKKVQTDVKKWQDDVDALYAHYQEVQSSTSSTTPVVISDAFVRNLLDYRESYDKMKKAEQNIVRSAEGKLDEMYDWAKLTFRTAEVQAVEKEIDKLSIDLREIEERMKPVVESYYKLSQNEQLIVENYKKLIDLEEWVIYKKDIARVQALINKIASASGWAAFKNATYDARFAYNNLNNYAKGKITNYSTLTAAEQKIKDGNPDNPTPEKPQPPAPSKDKIEVDGDLTPTGYTFHLTNDIVKDTIAVDGLKDLVLRGGGMTIAIDSGAANERLARLSEAEVTLSVIKDHTVTLDLTLMVGNQKRKITHLDDYIELTLPIDKVMDDTYQKVMLNDDGTTFAAVPFIDDGKNITLKPRTIGTYYVKESDVHFNDITYNIYEDAITFLANRYIVHGTTPTTYKPSNLVTRAQFSRMVARSLDIMNTKTMPSPFVDVRGKDFEQAVMALQKYDIIKGSTPDFFNPYANLTRQQGLVMMKRLLESLHVTLDYDGYEPYLDDWHQLSTEAQDAYIALEHLDLIDTHDGKFYPGKYLQRDEMAHMLSQTLKEAGLY